MKISSFYWFFEAIFFINLEIPVYKLNKTLNFLSIFRFLSILLLFFPKKTSEKQQKFSVFLLLLIICNLGVVINIENYYEILSLSFEIPLFLMSISIFTRKETEKQQEKHLLLKALNSSKEGLIILKENETNPYEISLFNEKALKLLNFKTFSKVDFSILDEKIKGFCFDKSKMLRGVNTITGFTLEKSSKEITFFASLSEILLFYQQKSKENEVFSFKRMVDKELLLSLNLKLVLKKEKILRKSFFFLSIRKIRTSETIKEKNEINTRLISSFSHELKTPLNSSIPLLTEVLQSEKPHNKGLIAMALSCLKVLENSLNNILDYSLILSEQFIINLGYVNLFELLTEVFTIIKEQVELKGIELHLEIDDCIEKTLCIYSDYIRLRQLLLNILLNAIQFTTSKGKISLKISVFTLKPLALEIRITDTGIGIPHEKLMKLNEKILSNDEIPLNSTGSCFGLIISNNIANLLGKYGIEINSKEKIGTNVRFMIVDQNNYEEFKGFKDKKQEKRECLTEKLSVYEFEKFRKKSKKQIELNKTIYKESRIFDSIRKTNLLSKKTISRGDNTVNFSFENPNDSVLSNSNDHSSNVFSKKSLNLKQPKNDFLKRNSHPITFPPHSYSPYEKKRKSFDSSKDNSLLLDVKVKAYNFDTLVNFQKQDKVCSVSEISQKPDKFQESGKSQEGGTSIYLNSGSFSQLIVGKSKEELNSKVGKERFMPRIISRECICADILIVDDDAFNLFSLEIMLKNFSFSCKKALNGQEAIEILKNFKKCHDRCKGIRLVLMDYQMPVLDGVESTKEIRKMIEKGEIEEIPVIGCTAFTAKTEVLKCLEAGMKDIFFKPLNRNVMQGIINQWM